MNEGGCRLPTGSPGREPTLYPYAASVVLTLREKVAACDQFDVDLRSKPDWFKPKS